MATETVTTSRPPLSVRLTAGWLDRETILGYFLLTPALVILVLFLAYPFLYGIWLSLTNAEIGGAPAEFVGLQNFVYLFKSDPIYLRTIVNTFEYTFVTVIFKFGLGLVMAAVLNVGFRFNRALRAAMLLPYIVPTVILITTLLSIITTFSDFQVIWILTRGGPVNSTHVIGTYAFQTGISGTSIGLGAAIALTMFPLLIVMTGVVLWLLR